MLRILVVDQIFDDGARFEFPYQFFNEPFVKTPTLPNTNAYLNSEQFPQFYVQRNRLKIQTSSVIADEACDNITQVAPRI